MIVVLLTKKTAEQIVYLNNHKQMYNYEQQFSISCLGSAKDRKKDIIG